VIIIHSRTLSHKARIVEQESSIITFVYCCVLMMIIEARDMALIKGSSRQVGGNLGCRDIWIIHPIISTLDEIYQF